MHVFPVPEGMRQSSVYQAILAEGRTEGAVHALVRFGAPRLGEPSDEALACLDALPSVDAVDTVIDRLRVVASWEELLRSESDGYKDGLKRGLRIAASSRLGEPSEAILDRLRAITSTDRIYALLDRLTDVETWDDLLAV